MPSARITRKGRITIPVDIRNDLKIEVGDRVAFVLIAPGRYEFVAATRNVEELEGMFGKPARTVSIDEMGQARLRRADADAPERRRTAQQGLHRDRPAAAPHEASS